MTEPFILLDDARPDGSHATGAKDARLYRAPVEVVVARRPDEVATALERIGADHSGDWAGYIAYEAGLALEPKLASRAAKRCGATGPLLWFGRFAGYETIPASEVPNWLNANASAGHSHTRLGPLEPQLSPGGYARAFTAMVEAIRAGDIYQANLTFPLAGSWQGDPVALYAAIRGDASAGHGGLIWDGSHWLLSFSPELFFALKDSEATVRPMKGTAPRGRSEVEDTALAEALSSSAKNRAENLMIVDLMRNDLGRVCVPGSVAVPALFVLESFRNVHHLVSTVTGRLRRDCGVPDLLAACFPGGSITGAPKRRAMEIIAELEPHPRDAYCGTVFWMTADGRFGSNIAIRTFVARDGVLHGWAGAGIVSDSDPDAEQRECLAKMQPLMAALESMGR